METKNQQVNKTGQGFKLVGEMSTKELVLELAAEMKRLNERLGNLEKAKLMDKSREW
jgi:hypothetical protein